MEDPATGLRRPRNYLQTLEAHVAHLEQLLQQARPDVALDHLGVGAADHVHGDLPASATPCDPFGIASPTSFFIAKESTTDQAPIPYHQRSSTGLGSDASFDDLSSEVALLCLSAAGREPHYFGPSSAVSFSRIAGQLMGLGKLSASSQSAAGMETPPRHGHPRSFVPQFPPPDVGLELSQAYFDNIHRQYPFLHKPTFKRWEQQCLAAHRDGDVMEAGDTPLFFVLMVYAIGSLALGDRREAAEQFYCMAMNHSPSLLETDSLISIQCILCCAVYSVRSPLGASLWKLSGMALRSCIELGYHRNAEKLRRTDILSREISKRCFWVAYDLDRVASVNLGRPEGISDESIDAEV